MTNFAQIKKYTISGMANSLFGYTVIFALMLLGVSSIIANPIGYIAGLILAFHLNRNWVFQTQGRINIEAIKFIGSFLVCFITNYWVLLFLLSIDSNPYIAQVISGVIYSVCMFLISKFFVFSSRVK